MVGRSVKDGGVRGKVEVVEVVGSLGEELWEGEIVELGNIGKEDL